MTFCQALFFHLVFFLSLSHTASPKKESTIHQSAARELPRTLRAASSCYYDAKLAAGCEHHVLTQPILHVGFQVVRHVIVAIPAPVQSVTHPLYREKV